MINVRETAVKYIKSLSQSERNVLKTILIFINKNNISAETFVNELKAIFKE